MISVLIIDDDQDIRFVLKMIFGKESRYDILEAGTLTEGQAMLDSGRTDVILLDNQLPDGSGLERLKTWSAEGLLNGRKLILLTASSDPAIRRLALEAGAVAVMRKPFDPTTFVSKLEQLLER